jgi:hypothetical protein
MLDGEVVIKNYLEEVIPKKYFDFWFVMQNGKKRSKSLTTSLGVIRSENCKQFTLVIKIATNAEILSLVRMQVLLTRRQNMILLLHPGG